MTGDKWTYVWMAFRLNPNSGMWTDEGVCPSA